MSEEVNNYNHYKYESMLVVVLIFLTNDILNCYNPIIKAYKVNKKKYISTKNK